MRKTYSGAIIVKKPGLRQVLIYSLSDILVGEMVVKFVLNEFIVPHCTIEGGSLFHSLTTSLVKNNFVQSSCLHLSFTPLLLVRGVLSIENILLAYTFVNFLRILKHSIFFPRSLRFSRETFSCASLSSYGLLCIFITLPWTASSFAISFAW